MEWHHFCIYSSGKYEISEAEGVQKGTKIIIHLKKDCWKFGMETDVKGRYSLAHFYPIYGNPSLFSFQTCVLACSAALV